MAAMRMKKETFTYSNMGIHSLIVEKLGSWITGLLTGLLAWRTQGLIVGLVVEMISGLSFWLLIWLLAFLIGSILRIWLWRRGSLPWNLSTFLDEAAERHLLYKVGDRYRFIHDLLQEYFAFEKERYH